MRHPLRFEQLEQRQLLTTFYVDGDTGNDLQSTGSLQQPFATISRATLFALPGDTVSIREGVYREQVNLTRSGTDAAPIVFEAYNGEQVTITTTEPLAGWTLDSGNIYTTTFDSSIRGRNGMTLFAGDELMSEAHWSDQGTNVNELDKQEWAKTDGDSTTTIRDNSLIGLPDDYWDGAFVHVQTANWQLESRRIADFDGSTGTLTVSSPFIYNPDSGTRYLIYDHLNALDGPGEWYFDEAVNTLYFWAPDGVDPNTLQVEAKIRDEAFDLNGHDHIQIKGIDFQGGDLDMTGSSHVLLQGAHVVAPDRGIGPEGSGGARGLDVSGDNNIIRDNEFEYYWTSTTNISGSNNQVVNNYFHHIGYNNSNYAAARLDVASSNTLISHNTITEVGRAAFGGAGGLQTVIQYNDISEIGRISDDVGALYFGNNSLGNMVIHHNVIHDNSNPEAWGIYFDNLSSDVAVHHNITYNVTRGGLANLSNSFILWFNNTHYGDSLGVTAFRNPNSPDIAYGTRFYNNILPNIDSQLTGAGDPAIATHNYFDTSGANFVNAAAGDFRLTSTSGAVDFGREIAGITDGYAADAPDAGALERGQSMWQYGHDFANPQTPTYFWQAIPYSNQLVNPGFEAGLAGWTVASGSPTTYLGNAWNYRDDGLALFGNYTLEVSPGDRVEQTITGLVPNTVYQVSAQARFAYDLQLENYSGSSGSFTTGTHRSESYLSGVDNGEWVRFDNVDFGTGSSLYDRIEIGTTQNSSLQVVLRIDNPTTGPILGTINVPSRGEPWFMTGQSIAAVTGQHDLYVVFAGGGGTNGKFDRIRLLDTDTSERVTIGATDYDSLSSETSLAIGETYWQATSEGFTFVTGPTSTSATFYIEKTGGHFNGYVDFVSLTGAAYQLSSLQLVVDPTTGSTVLRNDTLEPITFHGYTVVDSAGSLTPDTWFSLEAQGYDSRIWFTTPPTTYRVAELASSQQTTLAPGQQIYLGELVDPQAVQQLMFSYYNADTNQQTYGGIEFAAPGLPTLPGDYNGDGSVDLADFPVWRNHLGAAGDSFAGADGNGDGRVDTSDYYLWKRQFGTSAPSAMMTSDQPPVATPRVAALTVAYIEPLRFKDSEPTEALPPAAEPFAAPAPLRLPGPLARGRTAATSPSVEAVDAAMAADAGTLPWLPSVRRPSMNSKFSDSHFSSTANQHIKQPLPVSLQDKMPTERLERSNPFET